jgi:hypothetical protein
MYHSKALLNISLDGNSLQARLQQLMFVIPGQKQQINFYMIQPELMVENGSGRSSLSAASRAWQLVEAQLL